MENIVHNKPFEANRVWGVQTRETTRASANYIPNSQVSPSGGVTFLFNIGSSNQQDSRP